MTGFPFLRDLAERALKSFLQGALAVVVLQLGASGLGTNPLDLDAWQSLGIAALGGGITALGSLATSLLSKTRTGTASASVEVAESASQPIAAQGPPITRLADGDYDPKHDVED